MHSLYDVLLAQHPRQLTPVRCAYSTIVQLHRYFEDVVLENNLNALVIENLPLALKRPAREKSRVRDLARGERRAFFFIDQADALNELVTGVGATAVATPVILPQAKDNQVSEHFVLIADARFSALLATVRGGTGSDRMGGDEVFWTFDPDIVYSALEYLMARVGAQHPYHAADFEAAVRTSMPKAASLQLTVSVTTKLAHLLQEQASGLKQKQPIPPWTTSSLPTPRTPRARHRKKLPVTSPGIACDWLSTRRLLSRMTTTSRTEPTKSLPA